MKKRLLQGLLIVGTTILFLNFTSCNSGSGNKTDKKPTFNQEAYNSQLQGIFAYLPPNQGMCAIFDNHFISVFGDSDTTMVCHGGSYTTSGDTAVFNNQYASDSELIGSVIRWSAEFMENDSVKSIIYDDEGNITNKFYSKRKINVDEETLSQMKEWEGVYKYLSPNKAMGINFGGYILYGGQIGSGASGTAATYEYKNDTVTVKRLFALDPTKKGTGFRWINESINGDTLNWATINNAGEIMSRGKSVYIK